MAPPLSPARISDKDNDDDNDDSDKDNFVEYSK